MTRWSRKFDGVAESVGHARGFTRMVLDGHALADQAELVISELATNALAHTRTGMPDGTFVVELEVYPEHVRAAVVDLGSPDQPEIAAGDPASPALTGGRGLFLVEAMSAKWGCEPAGLGLRVWADIAAGA